jgi:signal transduction histidine kinase/CheY-like chemotaxis protein
MRWFSLVLVLASVPYALLIHGRMGFGGTIALLLVAVWLTLAARRGGSSTAWVFVALCHVITMLGFVSVGFLAGPAVSLSMTVTLAGLLLGTRWMLASLVVGGLGMLSVGWSMSRGWLPAPLAIDVSPERFGPWLRTTVVCVLVLGLFVRVILQVVERLELALRRVRDEQQAREAAEAARFEAERKALSAQKLETLGRLAAGIAHDFNNNLTAIIGLSELVRSELGPMDPRREMVDEILDASTRSAELTRQLLAVSRKAQPRGVLSDIQTVVDGAVRLFQRSAPHNVRLITRWGAIGTLVKLDQALIQNAILNLLINAKDAMPSGGTLTVSTKLEKGEGGDQVVIEVSDTGCGIPEEVLPHIFEPFFTTKNVGEGTGLGLASVATTIRGHGGEVHVETSAGSGTTFRLNLPIQTTTAPLTPAEREPRVAPGAHILVIDEDPSVRATAKANLMALGYRVTVAESSLAALQLLAADRLDFDLAILDLRGSSSGAQGSFESLQQAAPNLPVLLWSSYRGNQDVSKLLERGAVGFLDKPYQPSELGTAVARALVAREPHALVH